MSNGHWILDDQGQEIQVDVITWSQWFERATRDGLRQIARTEMDGILVSTVFLGLNHNWTPGGPPLIYETMAFGNTGGPKGMGEEIACERYSTRQEALTGHEEVCRRVLGEYYPLVRLFQKENQPATTE